MILCLPPAGLSDRHGVVLLQVHSAVCCLPQCCQRLLCGSWYWGDIICTESWDSGDQFGWIAIIQAQPWAVEISIALRLAYFYIESGLGKHFNIVFLVCVTYKKISIQVFRIFSYISFIDMLLMIAKNQRKKRMGRNFERMLPNGTGI